VPRVVIVGAGIAGLSVAHRLRAEPGLEVVVLEQADRPGGNLRSEAIDGFLCEWGPNGFLDSAPETLELTRALGLDQALLPSDDRARRRFVFRSGRLHLLPLSPAAFVTSGLLSTWGKLRVAAEPFARRRPEGDETIHAFASRRIGREAADVLIDPMVSGIFAGDARRLSLRAALPKMWELETMHGGLFRALWARRGVRRASGAPVGSPLGRLTSFVGGIETLTTTLARELGPRVRLGTRAVSIGWTPTAAASAWQVGIDGEQVVNADQVVLAGSPAIASRLTASLGPELTCALAEIPSAPVVVVALGYDLLALDHPLDGFGFLVPRGEGPRILGALWDSSVYPNRAPRGQALIRVMVGGAHDPNVLALGDEEIVRLVRTDLQLVMGVTAVPRLVRVIRHQAGIPQYTEGHLSRLERIDKALERWPGLHLAGNGYRGVAINNCIAEAGPLASRVLRNLGGGFQAA
jgi:protoporphyrinogen/coproporphyrinogen III oxidase